MSLPTDGAILRALVAEVRAPEGRRLLGELAEEIRRALVDGATSPAEADLVAAARQAITRSRRATAARARRRSDGGAQ
jgi:hypothetical protein